MPLGSDSSPNTKSQNRLLQLAVQEKHACGRLQRRAIHLLSQAAELSVEKLTTNVLPPLSAEHAFHPATKLLSCNSSGRGAGGGVGGLLALAESWCSIATRDGRRLKLESKPKSELAIARFLSRGGGFCSSQADASLKEVGLDALCPTHYNRTTADFVHRYLVKIQHKTEKVLADLQHKSIALICDASPKAKHDVWLPVFGLPDCLCVGTLQRLSTLLPSTATASQKLGAASLVAESHTKAMLAEYTTKQERKKLEDRLAAKQELKSVANVLSHIGLDLAEVFPSSRCAPIDADSEERRLHCVGDMLYGYVINKSTGDARWDTVAEGLRLVLCPDQGSALYATYEYMCHCGGSVNLIRDELHKINNHMGRVTSCSPVIKRMTLLSGWLFRAKKSPWGTSNFASTLKEAGERNSLPYTSDAKLNFERTVEILGKTIKYNSESFSWSRWCSWAHTSATFQMSSTLLLILWSSLEDGFGSYSFAAAAKLRAL
ncbi:unnamed protein product [Symbiodinium sp. CCMP2592]|nr:unnamed protein product [Symbiodinium sp. CCMP2592]